MPRLVLLAYGLANAVLYSAMLPLWEGFDEPFHFAYIQHLANGQGFPDPRCSLLSHEVAASIRLAPASRVVRENLPQVTTYSEYFSRPRFERAEIYKRLREIPRHWRWQSSDLPNYEAHHPPLAYAVLAMPERVLAGASLPVRVLVLRLTGALIGTALLYLAADSLFSRLGLLHPYRSAAIFCVFSCQMTWATIAHVANDWLAVPVAVYSFAMIGSYWETPTFRRASAVAGLLSIGLLTKSYFLAFIPAAIIPCLTRKRWRDLCLASMIIVVAAGPWYARNLSRYGALSGMQEARAGIGIAAVIRGAPSLDWPKVVFTGARAALWTGNNSFTSFSRRTLTAIVALWAIALILWAGTSHNSMEWLTVSYTMSFLAALAYITVVSYVYTNGAASGPSPWYAQVLLAPMLGLAFLGCARSQRLGRLLAIILLMLFGYVLIATYVVKLIPLYGGYEGRTSLAVLVHLYSKRLALIADRLNMLSFAPVSIIFGLAAMVSGMAVTQTILLVRAILPNVPFRPKDGTPV